uniref:4'-phosphopantetheine phosphatase n=2 Tax=Daphnia magna TaxID=35525 RepID=A0A0P6CRZ5_9CRUS
MPSTIGDKTYSKSIELPETEVFRNLKNAKRFAMDIGGSLTKIAYYSTVPYRKVLYNKDQKAVDSEGQEVNPKYEVSQGDRLHFVKFETKYIETCLDFLQENLVASADVMKEKKIKVTGGGAYKYADLLQEKLGLTVDKEEEMTCLIEGCNFLLKNIHDEVFIYQRHGNPEYRFPNVDPCIFPYLLVNIGSGVSIMKVEAEDRYERIGGTATGGGTFWGLGKLLTKAKGFDELLALAERGDHRKIDMLVKDIYGGDCTSLGLPGDLIASSFGKAAQAAPESIQEADIARSLLFAISNDIGQIASLYAMMHGLKKVYFGGYFLRNHPLSMHTVSFAINYWSRGQVQGLFLRHEGYLGAIGAFLKGAEECDADKYSWSENYAGSSGLQSPLPGHRLPSLPVAVSVDQLEMDRIDQGVLVYCPLLDQPASYVPDMVDLTEDAEARKYWLDCFEESLDKFVSQAIKSQPFSADAPARAQKFKEKYISRLQYLKQHPCAFGNLTVRSLLDTREHCLNEVDFPDPYLQQKQMENEAALLLLSDHLAELDALPWRQKHETAATNLLAGNVFDWGAKEAAALMQIPGFGFQQALAHLQKRPWFVDHVEDWLVRLEEGPHRCAAIFVDNSGMDVILGVLPFARELLNRGTKVILCANSKPALNDVTYSELVLLLEQAALISKDLACAMEEGRLWVMDSGQASPCLDLGRITRSLADAMIVNQVDLVVIEGMGRVIHTNLHAKFKCDVLKVAVIKNRWLARRFGEEEDTFPVVFQFERKMVL